MVGVCISENMEISGSGELQLSPWAVPRIVADVVGASSADGVVLPQVTLPGKLMISQKISYTSAAPVDLMILLRVHRSYRDWVTSNPNAIQIRDRWSSAIDSDPEEPLTTSVYNSQVGSAIDFGTNTVAQPKPGKHYGFMDAHMSEEWIGPLSPAQTLTVWYQCYLWTPPPFSDNANKNAPEHSARVRSTRLQFMAFPQQSEMVIG